MAKPPRMQSVGSGITARTKPAPEMVSPDQGLREWAAWLKREAQLGSDAPWRRHDVIISAARAELEEIRANQPDPMTDREGWFAYERKHFAERDSDGWYLLEIVRRANQIEEHIANGRAAAAANEGLFLGECLTELRIKADKEPDWLRGKRQREHSELGSEKVRKMDRVARHDLVAGILAENGDGNVRRAARRAARLSGAGSVSTFLKEYYKVRNAKTRSDP